jgi:hypothetical protein
MEQPPIFIDGEMHSAELVRRAMELAHPTDKGGVYDGGSLRVTESSPPGMSVTVAPGRAWVPGSVVAGQGGYGVDLRSATEVSIEPADSTYARRDLVCAVVIDDNYAGVGREWELVAVSGVPAPSPVPPAPPDNALVLAEVLVPASDTSITNVQITDRRWRISDLGPVRDSLRLSKSSQTVGWDASSNGSSGWGHSGAYMTGMTRDLDLRSVYAGGSMATVAVAGLYVLSFAARWTATSTSWLHLRIVQNSSTICHNAVRCPASIPTRGVVTSQLVALNAGDQIRWQACTEAGSAQTISEIRCTWFRVGDVPLPGAGNA